MNITHFNDMPWEKKVVRMYFITQTVNQEKHTQKWRMIDYSFQNTGVRDWSEDETVRIFFIPQGVVSGCDGSRQPMRSLFVVMPPWHPRWCYSTALVSACAMLYDDLPGTLVTDELRPHFNNKYYHQTSNISGTEFQNLNISRLAVVFAQPIEARC